MIMKNDLKTIADYLSIENNIVYGYNNDDFEKCTMNYKESKPNNILKKNQQSANTVFTKQQMIDLGISNDIPDLYEKYKQDKLRRIDFEIKWGKRICIFLMLSLIALFIYKTFINPQI